MNVKKFSKKVKQLDKSKVSLPITPEFMKGCYQVPLHISALAQMVERTRKRERVSFIVGEVVSSILTGGTNFWLW